MFRSYRAQELAGVQSVGTYRLKVRGSGEAGTESKWLTVKPSELEAIIAVLEPEDYAQAVEPEIRVALPTTLEDRHINEVTQYHHED